MTPEAFVILRLSHAVPLLLAGSLSLAQEAQVREWLTVDSGNTVSIKERVRLLGPADDLTYGGSGPGATIAGIATISAVMGGAPQELAMAHELLTRKDGQLERYRLELEQGGQLVRLSCTRTAEGVEFFALTPRGRQTRPQKAQGPLFLLDNNLFSHYDALGRFAIGIDQATKLTAVVPQRFAVLPGELTPGAETTVVRQQEGQEERRKARAYTLTVTSLRLTLVIDAETGAVYRVEIPVQKLTTSVGGWQPVAASQPTPQREVTWREREETLLSPLGELPVVLTTPKQQAASPPPVVLMLSGSGPNDRDETIGPNKPFRDLARGLAERGVASLRMDKRTYLLRERLEKLGPEQGAQLLNEAAGWGLAEEYTIDAKAAAKWLQGEKLGPMFVLGHSLGGLVAPQVARESQARGVILLAAAGRRLDELMEEQFAFQAGLRGKTEEEAETEAREALAPVREGLKQLEAGARQPGERALGASLAYWRDVLARSLPAELKKYSEPVLVLQGAKDCQVRIRDYELLRAALDARPAGAKPFAAELYPQLNHLFMKVPGQSTGAEYAEPGTLAPAVIERIASWVAATSGGR